jgi:hypothetical protein
MDAHTLVACIFHGVDPLVVEKAARAGPLRCPTPFKCPVPPYDEPARALSLDAADGHRILNRVSLIGPNQVY